MNKIIFEKFNAENFFDLGPDGEKMIFATINPVWEILSNLNNYIINLFKKGMVKANFQNRENIYVGEGTVIQEGAKIVGPAIIGKNCFIGHTALIRENSFLFDNVHIGHAVEVKNSIFLNNSVAAHFNYIGDSIIGSNVNISGGAICANWRLDKKKVSVRMGKQKLETDLDKFGSIIGDGSFIGANAVLNPGTVLGKNCRVFPLVSAAGFYPENSVIKSFEK